MFGFELSRPHHAIGVYIIRNSLRYIINAEHCISSSRRKCTLARDEIQGRLAALDDIHHASRGDDMPSCGLDKKITAPVEAVIFWRRRRDLNSRAGLNPTYTLSRGASSANLSTSPNTGFFSFSRVPCERRLQNSPYYYSLTPLICQELFQKSKI